MIKRDIDVIVIKGEFTRSTSNEPGNSDITVQEYTGSMLWLQKNSLLNIQKENDPFNLTDYIEDYINDVSHRGISHMVMNYVSLPSVYDTINPIEIVRIWNTQTEPSIITNSSFMKYSVTINPSTDDVRKKINSLKGINGKMYGYMEIYVYYKED